MKLNPALIFRPLRRRLGRIRSCSAGWIFSSLVGNASRSRCAVPFRSIRWREHAAAACCLHSSPLPHVLPPNLPVPRVGLEARAHTRVDVPPDRVLLTMDLPGVPAAAPSRLRRVGSSDPSRPGRRPQPRSFHLRCCSIPKEATETNVPPNTPTH